MLGRLGLGYAALLLLGGCVMQSHTGEGPSPDEEPTPEVAPHGAAAATEIEPGAEAPGAPRAPACAPDRELRFDDPETERERVHNAALADQLAQLEHLIGQYALGDAPIYEGRFHARDNIGVLPGYEDGVMDTGDAIASITFDDRLGWDEAEGDWIGGHVLTVYSREDFRKLRLGQVSGATDVTELSFVQAYNTYGGVTGTCTDCAPVLESSPGTIALDALRASGTWGDGTAMTIEADGRLERIPPRELDFEQIAAVHGDAFPLRYPFERRDDEMVLRVDGVLEEPAPVPEGTDYESCEHVTEYSVEWFVNRSCLADYGMRDLQIASQRTCCFDPMADEGCVPGGMECF